MIRPTVLVHTNL